MKRGFSPTLALALSVLFGGIALAEEIAPAPSNVARPVPDQRQRRIDSVMQTFEKLGLSEQQKSQIRPLVKTQFDELRAIRMDSALPEAERQERTIAALKSYETQIGEILTPDQKARLDQIRKANRDAARAAGVQKPKGRPIEEPN